MCHLTDHMDKIPTIEVLEPIFIGAMCVWMMVKLMSRWVFNSVFITSILGRTLEHVQWWRSGTYSVLLFVKHERGYGPTLIGAGPCLSMNMDSSTANAEVIGGARDSAKRRRHQVEVIEIVQKEEGIEWKWQSGSNWNGWWGTTSQWCSLYPFPVRIIAGPERTDHLTQLRVVRTWNFKI